MGGGALHTAPEKLWMILCNSFKWLYLHKYMADNAIILYLGFLVGFISYFEKLGQCDLNKKKCAKNIF